MESGREKDSTQMPSNKFKVLVSRVMNMGKQNRDKKKEKKKRLVKVRKEEKGEFLKKVTVKMKLERIDM